MVLSPVILLAKPNPDKILPVICSMCASVQPQEMEKNTTSVTGHMSTIYLL